jgi:hypothetical protein
MNVLYSAISSEIHCAGSDGSKLEAPVLPVPNAAGTPSASLITTPADRDSHCRVTASYYFLHVSLTVHGFPHRSNIDKSTTSNQHLSQNRTFSESQSQLTQLSNNRTTQVCAVLLSHTDMSTLLYALIRPAIAGACTSASESPYELLRHRARQLGKRVPHDSMRLVGVHVAPRVIRSPRPGCSGCPWYRLKTQSKFMAIHWASVSDHGCHGPLLVLKLRMDASESVMDVYTVVRTR